MVLLLCADRGCCLCHRFDHSSSFYVIFQLKTTDHRTIVTLAKKYAQQNFSLAIRRPTVNSHMLEPKLYCYRQNIYCDYDEEAIWALVQRHDGFLNIRGDCIDYWIPTEYRTLLLLAYPKLTRQPSLDYL